MKRVKDCKNVSIMSPQDEQWGRTSLLYRILQFSCFTKYTRMQSKHKQTKCENSRRNYYSFLSRYHCTKSRNYLKRRYRIRHLIPMFIGMISKIFYCIMHKYILLNNILYMNKIMELDFYICLVCWSSKCLH